MEALMEKIRFKQADSQRSLADSSKQVRMSMADRRHSLDINDKAILRSCLDVLQSSISVKSVTGMSERLETTARQLGLKFIVHSNNSNTHNFYISTETFYVEICIDKSGSVLETRIHHQNPQGSTPNTIPAPEITECLAKGDFPLFVSHLKGLISVYDLADCSNLDKTRAWQALYNLEHDLTLVASGQSWVTDVNQIIHKTGLGMVHTRSGGIPMKLRYFLPPYELLDMKQQTILPMNQSTITDNNLGFCATITLRSSTEPYLLPMSSLISSTGKDLPITNQNAIPLPAHFALVLDKPLALSQALLKQIMAVTNISWLDIKNNSPLLALIVKHASDGGLDPSNNRGLFVTLPDQQHCYFMTETPDLIGQLVEYIPFRHPKQVAAIIDILRRQALFNTLLSSCVRTSSLEDVDTSTMFEVTCLDPTCQNLSVSFEHPAEETMATAELSLSDLMAPRCLVYTGCMAVCPEETANIVLQRSLSIPITMRAVINKGKGKIKQKSPDEADIHVGSGLNGLGPGLDMDHKSVGSGMAGGGRYKVDGGRNSLTGGLGGTPACVKQEAPAGSESGSLNRCGPQLSGPAGARPDKTFRHPAAAFLSDNMMSLSRSLHLDTQNKKNKERSVQPNVSITPIQLSSTQYEDSISRMPATTGIEIIPLGGKLVSSPGTSGMLKAKSRDLKRSLSEDDKRRLQKKEKKRRDEKIRQSLNQEPGKYPKSEKFEVGGHSSWSSESDSKSIAGVIERLSQKNKDNVSIELKSASSALEKFSSSPNMEITLNHVKKEDYNPKPKLKLTIKTPNKHFEKTETDGGFGKTTSASPKLESSTFQIPKLNKSDLSTMKKERQSYPIKSPSTSPKHSVSKTAHAKINERFITDPSSAGRVRPEERKREAEREEGEASLKIKSSVSRGLGELSPLSDSLLDEGLLMKWLVCWRTALASVLRETNNLPISLTSV